jgi:hypothetical protein
MMKPPQALHHFLVGQVFIRDTPAEVQDLPESNCESPYVALGRVLSLEIRIEIKRSISTISS